VAYSVEFMFRPTVLCSNLEHLRLTYGTGNALAWIRWGGKWVHLI